MRLEHGLGRAATPKLERVNVQIPLRVSSVTLRGTTTVIENEKEIEQFIKLIKLFRCLFIMFNLGYQMISEKIHIVTS